MNKKDTKPTTTITLVSLTLVIMGLSMPIGAQTPIDPVEAPAESQAIEIRPDIDVELVQMGEPVTVTRAEIAAWLATMDSEARSAADLEDVLEKAGVSEDAVITDNFLDAEGGFIDADELRQVLRDHGLVGDVNASWMKIDSNLDGMVESNLVQAVMDLLRGLIQEPIFDGPGPLPGREIRPPGAGKVITCSGGSSTVMGWADYVTAVNTPTHVMNGPASSYYVVTYDIDKGEVMSVSGHTRSALDDINIQHPGISTWTFANVPMGGPLGFGFSCLYVGTSGILTSVSVGASGTPLGLPIGGILHVSANGVTCLVPC